MKRDDFVQVGTYTSEVDAQLAAATLAAANIYSYLDADDAGGMIPALDGYKGVRLFVETGNAEEARTILGTVAEPTADQDPSSDPAPTA